MYGYGNSMFLATHGILAKANAGTPPVNTVAPVISGTQVVGSTLTTTTGTWTGTPVISYTYQWYRGATLISGATSSSYTLVQADAGNTSNITCQVTGTNAFGNATATSNTLAQIFDFDANAFITAASITNNTQKSATNTLTIDLKAYSIWTKFKAIYPIVGGTAATHKWNLKDPRDLDAAFRLTFATGWTHSSTGMTPLNTYADTKFLPSTNLGVNSNSLGYYSGTNLSETISDPCNMGAFISVTQAMTLVKPNSTLSSRLNGSLISYSTATMRGFFSASKQSSTLTDIYLNGSQVGTGNSGGTLPNDNVLLGTISIDTLNNPYGNGYVKNDFRFAYLSDGLNDTEMSNLYTAVQAYQTTLGRQV